MSAGNKWNGCCCHKNINIYYVKVSGIASGNKLIKTIRYPHMWRYDIFTCEEIDDSVISSFSLKLYLNSLAYHRNIFGSSSKVFGNLRKSSDIFGNFRKFSEHVRERSSGLRNNFRKSSEISGKWSEIFGKSSKTPSSVCLYNKKNITR